MDTTKPSQFSKTDTPAYACSCAELAAQLHADKAPLTIDVRKQAAFLASSYTLHGALRRDPAQLDAWAATLPRATSMLLYCVHGHEVSQNAVTALRLRGIDARFLEGGIEAWREQGLALFAKAADSATRWVTRERPKVDRIACPWLLRRFVDAQARFLYVPAAQVSAAAQQQNATPYDVNADVAATAFTHDGAQCSFDAFIKNYRLGADAALGRLADIVRAADTDRLELAPQAAGLLAVSLGMSRRHLDDHAMLEAMLPVYDALYAWCVDAVAGSNQQHKRASA